MKSPRSLALALLGLALTTGTGCSTDVDGSSGAAAGPGGGSDTSSSSSGAPCCPKRGQLGFFPNYQIPCADGFQCPWLYGDTGAVGGGVATCEGGSWKLEDCPDFEFVDGEECPAEGTDLGPCDAPWEDTLCICACLGAEPFCGKSVTCVGGRWRLGAFETDARTCLAPPGEPGCTDPDEDLGADYCFGERDCDDGAQAIDCFLQDDGTIECSCFRQGTGRTDCVAEALDDACSFTAGCCASAFLD